MELSRRHIDTAFSDYVRRYDASDPKIALKVVHTRRVARLCDEIAADLGLGPELVDLAWTCGMLHDIGRFEQIARYHTFADARSVDHAALGAQVLNNRSVELAKSYGVQLEVLSSFSGNPGTIVKEVVKNVEKTYIAGVAQDKKIARIALAAMPDVPGVAYKVFSLLAKEKINVDMILQSYGHDECKDIVFTVADKDVPRCEEVLNANRETLKFDHIDINTDVAKLSVVGAGMQGNPGVAAKMFEALYAAHINIHMISTSEIKLSVLIDKEDSERAMRAVHAQFFQ